MRLLLELVHQLVVIHANLDPTNISCCVVSAVSSHAVSVCLRASVFDTQTHIQAQVVALIIIPVRVVFSRLLCDRQVQSIIVM